MKPNDYDPFMSALVGVADYYGKTLSEGAMQVYWQGLKDYDLSAVEKAMWQHAQSGEYGQFMPKISDITKLIEGGKGDKAALAWTKFDKAIRHVGTWQDVIFDDPIIHCVVSDMGGWTSFGTKTDKEWPFIQREFETRYRGYANRVDPFPHPRVLTGAANAQNSREGRPLMDAVSCGVPAVAQHVYLTGSDKPAIEFTRVAVSDTSPKRLK